MISADCDGSPSRASGRCAQSLHCFSIQLNESNLQDMQFSALSMSSAVRNLKFACLSVKILVGSCIVLGIRIAQADAALLLTIFAAQYGSR